MNSPLKITVLTTLLQLGEVGKGELVGKSQGQARVLEHVVEREILDKIIGSVDVVVRILESRLDDEGGRVASLGGRGVIRAGISALCLDVGDVAVLLNDLLDKISKVGVDKINDNTDTLDLAGLEGAGYVASHVLLEHGLDVAMSLLIGGEDGLAAKKTTLLSTVPVELDGVLVVALDNVL